MEGQGGVHASQLQIWLKTYESYSKELCKEVTMFIEWVGNVSPLCASTRAIMAADY